MDIFGKAAVTLLIVGVSLPGWLAYIRPQPEEAWASSRIRYVGEERAAVKACGTRQVKHWWIENPRKGKATMHVNCAGQVITAEVKF